MKNMIKTSVIIPVYNTSIYIEECMNSVFCQTQKEIEVIAINDGSTDNSLEILLRLQEKHPELIVFTQENHGLGYVRNVGIEKARGEYIYFLDSDDYILEDTLEKCYECASENKLDIVLFDAFEFEDCEEKKPVKLNPSDKHEIVEERDEIFSGIYYLEKYCQSAYTPESCLMYCSSCFLKENNIKFLTGAYFEDNEFYCRSLTLADRVMYIPRMFYQYRCRKNSITGTDFSLKKAKDHIEVIRALTDLKLLKEGKGWDAVKKISFNLLWYVTNMCYENKLYDKDSQLSEQILNVWVRICGKTIENIDSLEDITYIYKLSKCFPNTSLNEEKNLIQVKRKQLLIQELKCLPFHRKGYQAAIYGYGEYTKKVLDIYEKWVAPIRANLIFLDSYVKNDTVKDRGYSLFPVSEIGNKKIDCIYLSSPEYEKEMGDMIQELYGDKFAVVSLFGDLHIDV